MGDPREPEPSAADLLAAQQAQREQALAEAPVMAKTARVLFDAYEAEGFSAMQALYLTAVVVAQPDFKAP